MTLSYAGFWGSWNPRIFNADVKFLFIGNSRIQLKVKIYSTAFMKRDIGVIL